MAYHCKNKSHEDRDCTYCSLSQKKFMDLEDIHSWVICSVCSNMNETVHHCQNKTHRHKECQLCPAIGYIESFDIHYWVKCNTCSNLHEEELKTFYQKNKDLDLNQIKGQIKSHIKSQINNNNIINHNNINESDPSMSYDNGLYKCQHCNMMLKYGYDDNDMLHCQGCHNIYDGNAQCMCDTD